MGEVTVDVWLDDSLRAMASCEGGDVEWLRPLWHVGATCGSRVGSSLLSARTDLQAREPKRNRLRL